MSQRPNHAFEQAPEVIRIEPRDLSLYRTILLPDQLWHVLVLGGIPQQTVHERIYAALQQSTKWLSHRDHRGLEIFALNLCDLGVLCGSISQPAALEGGEAVQLAEHVWGVFNQRRLEQSAHGPWVERRTPRRRLP